MSVKPVSVLRYDFCRDSIGDCYCEMRQKPDGDYVDYSEYAKLEARLKAAEKLIRDEFMTCANNDCTCRKGYGLCVQCKDAAERWLKDNAE